jgi:hypothetical protein
MFPIARKRIVRTAGEQGHRGEWDDLRARLSWDSGQQASRLRRSGLGNEPAQRDRAGQPGDLPGVIQAAAP